MNALVAIALTTLAIAQLQRYFRTRGELGVEGVTIAGASWLAIVGVTSMGLGLFGRCTPTLLTVTLLVASAASVARVPTRPRDRDRRRYWQVLIGIVAVGAALRAPPMPAPLAGTDPGSYRLRAESHARTGSIHLSDTVLPTVASDLGRRAGPADVLGLYPDPRAGPLPGIYDGPYRPGFYLADTYAGRVVPQFFHLYPSLLAAFVVASPLHGIALATGLLGLLALLAFAAVARRLVGARWALLATALLSVTPVAVWTHRNPLTESLIGVLLWAAALAWIRATDATRPDAGRESDVESRRADLGAGAWLLGAATLVRGDAWVWGPVVAAGLWTVRGERRPFVIFAACLAAGAAVHATTSFPYVHDEIARRLPVALLTPGRLAAAAAIGFVAWALIDRAGARGRQRIPAERRVPVVLVGALAIAALAWWWTGRSPARPFSRLDALPAAASWPLIAAALVGGAVVMRRSVWPAGPASSLLAVPLVTLWLFAPRNLPDVGLYYYGRYLVPVVLPVAILLATVGARALASMLPALAARAVSIALGLALVWSVGNVLLRSSRTRIVEHRGAAALVDRLAASVPADAIIVAGGEGWHAGFTFNQIAGALALRHGISVVPYGTREAAYATMVELAEHGERPVYLLVNEATHHYTRADDGQVVAAADDLLSAPLVARSVRFVEYFDHHLTADRDAAPVRVTRDGLRAELVEIASDPLLGRRWRLGEADPADGLIVQPDVRAATGVCLNPATPVSFTVPPGPDGPAELVVVAVRGTPTRNERWTIAIDGTPVVLAAPQSRPRSRDTLGPIPWPRRPRTISIRSGSGTTASAPCPHGGVSELRVGPSPRSALDSVDDASAAVFLPPDDLDEPFKISGWVPGRALTRFRPGTRGATVRGLSLRVRPDQTLRFAPLAWPPGDFFDVIVTTTGTRANPSLRVRVSVNDEIIALFDPPDRRDGSWQGPKTRIPRSGALATVMIELLHAEPGDWIDIRDVAMFSVTEPLRPR